VFDWRQNLPLRSISELIGGAFEWLFCPEGREFKQANLNSSNAKGVAQAGGCWSFNLTGTLCISHFQQCSDPLHSSNLPGSHLDVEQTSQSPQPVTKSTNKTKFASFPLTNLEKLGFSFQVLVADCSFVHSSLNLLQKFTETKGNIFGYYKMDGWKDGWRDGRMDGRIDRWMDGLRRCSTNQPEFSLWGWWIDDGGGGGGGGAEVCQEKTFRFPWS